MRDTSRGSARPVPVEQPGTTTHPVPEDEVLDLRRPRQALPALTTTTTQLDAAAAGLARGSGPVAVDAERASGFRYGQDAYLVQLRREDVGTVLVDPVGLADLAPLDLALRGTEWVLHAADQDLPCLAAVGMRPDRLFDTELAAKILGRAHVGLGAMVEETLGLRLAKEHSAADWSTRPLPVSWLVYAALDVELLVALREALAAELARAGRTEWASQEFEHVRTSGPRPPRVDPWRRTPRAGRSVRSPRSLAVLREMWTAREELAVEMDLTPSKVLSNHALVAAASARPTSRRKLASLREFSSRQARQHAEVWWKAVERALALDEDQLPSTRAPLAPGELPQPRSWARHHPQAAARLDLVRPAVRERAEALGLSQEVLLTPDVQRHLAWEYREGEDVAVRLAALGARPWQVEQVSPALAAALGHRDR